MIADALCDCADALVASAQLYVSGRKLHRLQSLDRRSSIDQIAADDGDEDVDVHRKIASVIKSRVGFEEAVKGASWEGGGESRKIRFNQFQCRLQKT